MDIDVIAANRRLMKLSVGIFVIAMLFATRNGAAGATRYAPSISQDRPTIVNWALDPVQIRATCRVAIAKAVRAERLIAASRLRPTFENTTLALENLGADLNDELVAQTFLAQVSPDAGIRDASRRCSNDAASFVTDESANPVLYRRLAEVGKASLRLDTADRALSKISIDGFHRSGAGLTSAERVDFVRLSKTLTDLELQFSRNVEDDATTISITKAQEAGLPIDLVATMRPVGSRFAVRVNDSTAGPFLENATDESARKSYAFAYGNIASPANISILERAIAIRYRLARLMGFRSWAAYQLDVRVDRSPQHISAFLEGLDTDLLPRARETVAELTALKIKTTGNRHAVLRPWDVWFYTEQLDKAKFAVDEQEVRQYFPAPHTVDAILSIYERLLGVRFRRIPNALTWYPGVTEYSVTDGASRKLLGSFFLDLYPRDGKPGGAFNAAILPVRKLHDGTYRPPISAMIVSDWPAADSGTPALLTHEDVVTFFHEFGHNMAALLTTAPYESLTHFQQDFVEAPSQMLENFAWDPSVLRKISSNVRTREPMPRGLVSRLVRTRCATDRVCNAYTAVRQIELAVVDLDYHMAGPKVDTTAVFDRVVKQTTPLQAMQGIHPQASFRHLMGGYDAGYYTYLWSLVYAQDLFTAFQQAGLANPLVGSRYRTAILAPAGTVDPAVEVKHFLGRPMSTNAFYHGFRTTP